VSLEAFGVKNLRCLGDTGLIPLKPITLLVGRNSSGKSTFLRAFPLLKQSVQTPTESPILWYHERYVDFGALQQAINHKATDKSVTLEFSVTLPKSAEIALGAATFHVAMTLAEAPSPQGPYVREYAIRYLDHAALLQFTPVGDVSKFEINGQSVFPGNRAMSLGGAAYLLPTLVPRPESHAKITYQPVMKMPRLDPPEYRIASSPDPLLDEIVDVLRHCFHGSTGERALRDIGNDLLIGTRDAMWQRLKSSAGSRRMTRGFSSTSVRFTAIVNRTIARMVPWVLDAIDQEAASFMDRVAYLAPLRATAARSYRVQDLSVNDVDPDGKNLAMFIRSLSKEDLESFAAFTRRHLGFESKVEVSGLHAEILVKEPHADRYVNLVDIGFGYTEVLPLMAILWSACFRQPTNGHRPTSLLAVEQPELHLHPAHQAKLAGIIADAWKTSRDAGREVKIMIETHSEGIINRMGDLIQDEKMSPADVQIVFFDQDPETRETKVRVTGYAEDGALREDWPFGFFAPLAD
jgi:predicted ATPase